MRSKAQVWKNIQKKEKGASSEGEGEGVLWRAENRAGWSSATHPGGRFSSQKQKTHKSFFHCNLSTLELDEVCSNERYKWLLQRVNYSFKRILSINWENRLSLQIKTILLVKKCEYFY